MRHLPRLNGEKGLARLAFGVQRSLSRRIPEVGLFGTAFLSRAIWAPLQHLQPAARVQFGQGAIHVSLCEHLQHRYAACNSWRNIRFFDAAMLFGC
jgi:hypothetical protein